MQTTGELGGLGRRTESCLCLLSALKLQLLLLGLLLHAALWAWAPGKQACCMPATAAQQRRFPRSCFWCSIHSPSMPKYTMRSRAASAAVKTHQKDTILLTPRDPRSINGYRAVPAWLHCPGAIPAVAKIPGIKGKAVILVPPLRWCLGLVPCSPPEFHCWWYLRVRVDKM